MSDQKKKTYPEEFKESSVKEERDLLKKATAYFAREHK